MPGQYLTGRDAGTAAD